MQYPGRLLSPTLPEALMAAARTTMVCRGGPFDGQTREVRPDVAYLLVSGARPGDHAAYRVHGASDRPFLEYDSGCMPAYASEKAPIQLQAGGRPVRIWTSSPASGEPRWVIDDGTGHHRLSPYAIDAATMLEDVERMATGWIRTRQPPAAT